MLRIQCDWSVGFSDCIDSSPQRRVPASVPGAVQLDWAKAEGWGDYFYGDNFKDYEWMEDVYWTYSTVLDFPEIREGERLIFKSFGIDYCFDIKLGKEVIYQQEGMFTPFEIDLTDIAEKGDTFEIIIHPVPKREGAHPGRSQADQCCKPAVSYGWDWHPRLIPLGIWDETYLEVRNTPYIIDAEISYELEEDFKNAYLKLHVKASEGAASKIRWEFYDRSGNLLFTKEKRPQDGQNEYELEEILKNPELWWPNGQGEAVLYDSLIEIYNSEGLLIDNRRLRTGFKRARLVMHPGAWNYPEGFPKSRSNPPITLEINGRSIFCKGTNWVNPEIFPGLITCETYRPLIEAARDANMNILRSWGGGIINKEAFFHLCDEYGIMVWQEFPLACNNYEGTRQYLEVLDRESRSIIRRIRPHACLVMWCGGNELFNGWSGMTDQSLALRLLNKNCYELDRHTPFIATSPLSGMGHGNYLFRYHTGEEVFQVMPEASCTAYTEFGCPGPSDVEYIKKFMPENELFPPKAGTSWETHHAFKAWTEDTWLVPGTIEHYFGPLATLEELVERGQLLQSEGYKCIFEEARRQKPVCSMALNWCYNEPWPSAANNSIINWPCIKKPSYYAVGASCRPVLASARIPKFSWNEGEVFNPELWMLNDLPGSVERGIMEASIDSGKECIKLLTWEFSDLDTNTNLPGPVIRYKLPRLDTDRIKLRLSVKGHPEMDSEYVLAYKRTGNVFENEGPRTLNT